ncbi:hypothetical protein HDU97_003157 [Phlyctochytrium planicorne]|nr:hypothetical protein HDU97_003157 [Phlyctochytrium planicorne]
MANLSEFEGVLDARAMQAIAAAKASISNLTSPPATPPAQTTSLQTSTDSLFSASSPMYHDNPLYQLLTASSDKTADDSATNQLPLPLSSRHSALLPVHIAPALVKYESLSATIWRLYPFQERIPIQKRFITNVRNRLELEKKELDRRDGERKKYEAQLKSLQTLSFTSVAARINGNFDQKMASTVRELEMLKKADEKVRNGIDESSSKLLRALAEAAVLDEKNAEITKVRKELRALLEEVFQGDKEDESIRLKIISLKNTLKSTLDELDRHVAAEAELKMAVKYMEAAILILKVLIDYDTNEEFVIARFIVEATEMALRAEILTQNAFSIDAMLPEHQAIPEPDPSITNTSVKIRNGLSRVQNKLDQIYQSLNFLFESIQPLKPRAKRLAQEVVETEAELTKRRIEVMENCIEVVIGEAYASMMNSLPGYDDSPTQGGSSSFNLIDISQTAELSKRVGAEDEEDEAELLKKLIEFAEKRPRITEALVLLPVGPPQDVDARRPTPAPSRLVSSVPTVSESLPVYQP